MYDLVSERYWKNFRKYCFGCIHGCLSQKDHECLGELNSAILIISLTELINEDKITYEFAEQVKTEWLKEC